MCLKEREGERERGAESCPVLVHCLNAHNSWGCTRLKPGYGNSILGLLCGWQEPTTAASQGVHLQEAGVGSGAKTNPGTRIWDAASKQSPDTYPMHL